MGGLSLSINISLASVLWVGGSIIGNGALTTGELASFMMYSGFMCLGFAQLSTLAGKIRSTNDATQVLFDLLNDAPPTHSTATIEAVHGALAFDRVVFAYPDHSPLFREFSWAVPAGAMVALVGASGAGKSTLANILTRLVTPAGGRVLLDGVDIATLDKTFLRRTIGMEAAIFGQSIADNIRYADPAASHERVVAAATAAHAHEFIVALPHGYDTVVTPTSLSGGQKQRVALARALLSRPHVLVLDEATAALDGRTEHAIQDTLKQLRDITVVVIAHRLSTIRTCDSIAVLDDGAIIETGSYDQLNRDGTAFHSLVASHAIEATD
ncbi:Aste57867_20574 [Aphanomyces stellatus]|uniref:Aste57867_20574 protein n=1 Tax=Aphanomyces stellatus TaxID=120398 RepID=A0A485LGG3_9STRA|nr:hypothetical protein As57867_020507 [Aphanomyces stellatus]VFT97255.1 Aste57867_20574 [Aphanomyces stellatus]